MNVAIVHYHLNRGGVTQVIVNHLRSLDTVLRSRGSGRQRIALVYGGRREGFPEREVVGLAGVEVSFHELPGLEYESREETRCEDLSLALEEVLAGAGFRAAETVVHAHNHALGKNASLPGALVRLAREGWRLLLQIHDFPEDFRPANYRRLVRSLSPDSPRDLPGVLYPQAPQIHYGVLNRRDLDVLLHAGVDDSRLHWLPNPVPEVGQLPAREEARAELAARFGVAHHERVVLYPVRGIRRKNIGEALLWSALAGTGTRFSLTLPPLNPVEQPAYAAWKRWAASLDLPFVFESGGPSGLSFRQNLAASDKVLTTSVAEGFGMVFLETWLAGRFLVGRDLPEVTSDFRDAGVALDGLRPTLWVAAEGLDRREVVGRFAASFGEVVAMYDMEPPPEAEVQRVVEVAFERGRMDFAQLTRSLQAAVIQEVSGAARARERILELNPWIVPALALGRDQSAEAARRNADVVRRNYSLDILGRRLEELYRRVLASEPATEITAPSRGELILGSFLNPDRFHPIRVEP